MKLEGKVVIVTGGANGIGRAMAERFAAEGARGVVVADLDGEAARSVAEGINTARAGASVAVRCDVGKEEEVAALIAQAEDAFGPVDLFCANAGVGLGTDLSTPDEVWNLVFDVNIKAHIYAAKYLVSGWLERGDGYFLSTASAAGLLTQIGSAPYAVTKHAAVAFAEWLSVTYGDRGLKVSCLCPMGVNTNLLNAGRSEPQGTLAAAAAAVVVTAGAVLEPDDVAGMVVQAIEAEQFLILPHPEVLDYYQHKGADYDHWIRGMRRLQAQVSS